MYTKPPLKSINKTQIIQVISDRLDVTRVQATRFLEVLSDIAAEALQRDGIFMVADLVQFSIKETKERTARNLKGFNGQIIEVPAIPPTKKVVAKPLGKVKNIKLT